MNKNLLFWMIIIFFLNNCSFLKKIDFFPEKQTLFLNFKLSAQDIIKAMLNNKNIIFSKKISLYVGIINNKSNIFLENKKLTNILKKEILKKINQIKIIDYKTINTTKKQLGSSVNNNTLDIPTSILLSRSNNITYYLNSYISGKKEPFFLKVQLILVKTGEILFYKTKKIYF